MNIPLLQRFLVACACLAGATWCTADTIWVKSETTGKPLAYNNVKVQRIAKGESAEDLFYLLQTGTERSKPLDQIVQIKLDDDPIFSAAEEAFANDDMKNAAAGYRKAMASPSRPWIKRRADLRLVQAAGKTGDFGDSVLAFVALAQKTPDAAGKSKPAIAGATPQQIDAAIATVRTGIASATSEQKQVLLPFLAELYTAKKDTASAQQAMAELTRLNPAAANTAEVKQAKAEVALGQARDALSQKNYTKVTSTLGSNATLFTEAAQQSEAMFLLAEAKDAAANDEIAMKDAALAYMRVVANFKSAPGAPHVAEALFKAAQIEEKLKDVKSAQILYKEVATNYKDSPSAKPAQEKVDQLK